MIMNNLTLVELEKRIVHGNLILDRLNKLSDIELIKEIKKIILSEIDKNIDNTIVNNYWLTLHNFKNVNKHFDNEKCKEISIISLNNDSIIITWKGISFKEWNKPIKQILDFRLDFELDFVLSTHTTQSDNVLPIIHKISMGLILNDKINEETLKISASIINDVLAENYLLGPYRNYLKKLGKQSIKETKNIDNPIDNEKLNENSDNEKLPDIDDIISINKKFLNKVEDFIFEIKVFVNSEHSIIGKLDKEVVENIKLLGIIGTDNLMEMRKQLKTYAFKIKTKLENLKIKK